MKRVKQTELGELPEEWDVVRLSDAGNFINGYAFKPSDWKKRGLPIVRIQNLNNPLAEFNYYDREMEERYILDNGDLLLSWSASLGIYVWNRGKAVLNQHIFKVVPKSHVDKIFLYWICHKAVEDLKKCVHGSTMRHFKKRELDTTLIPLPPLPEQKKIASILSTADDAIQKTNEIIEKTQELKKGLMQQLLIRGIGHTKFKKTEIGKIPEEWDVMRLGDYCNFTTGKLNSNQAVTYGQYPFFTCSPNTLRIDRYSFDCEAILLAGNNASGVYSVKYYNGKFDAYQRTYVITLKSGSNLEYIYLKNALVMKLKDLKIASIGTNTKFLTLKLLLNFQIPLPPLPEQRKIASILSTVDEKVEIERKRKQKLEELKKGLMQNLLTGKVRVKVS